MIKFFFAFLFLSAGCACMAQDRIHTKDGRVIECKVSDSSNRAGNVFFFPADDPETSHFIPVTQVDYLEIGDERVVRTPNDKLKPAETRFGLKAPALPHMLGATYDFLSNTYVHTHGTTVSYAYFFDGRNGIHAELAYRSLESASASERRADPGTSVDIFAVIPHYERRFYIQRMGSFYFVRGGLGVNVYTASIQTDAGESREGLAAPVVSLAMGLDFRVSRNLYLEVAARYIGDFASWNFGYDSEPLLANEGFFGGFSVGLRFGWGR